MSPEGILTRPGGRPGSVGGPRRGLGGSLGALGASWAALRGSLGGSQGALWGADRDQLSARPFQKINKTTIVFYYILAIGGPEIRGVRFGSQANAKSQKNKKHVFIAFSPRRGRVRVL